MPVPVPGLRWMGFRVPDHTDATRMPGKCSE